jgi:predicted small secreted protein
MMKHTKIALCTSFLGLVLCTLTLTSCGTIRRMNELIQESGDAIRLNREAIERNTEAIKKNKEMIDQSNRAIEDNRHHLEQLSSS